MNHLSLQFDLASIGGYLQLDRCIYPYIISSSDILLNINDLRQPFNDTLHSLMPYFLPQSSALINNYKKIVDYGTRSIKKYKYYSKNIDEKFISLYHLLLVHRSFFFVQLFHSKKISLCNLHEFYRSDFSNLLSKNISNCGYFNYQPCLNNWSVFDSTVTIDQRMRLANQDEILLINWLLIYDNQCLRVHHQTHDQVLVKQQLTVINEKMKFLQNEHVRKRAIMINQVTM